MDLIDKMRWSFIKIMLAFSLIILFAGPNLGFANKNMELHQIEVVASPTKIWRHIPRELRFDYMIPANCDDELLKNDI